MPNIFLHISADSDFVIKEIGRLGIFKHGDEIHKQFIARIEELYGVEHLEDPGLTYHDIDIYSNKKFKYFLDAFDQDQEVLSFWRKTIKCAKVSLAHQGIGNQLECEWQFEMNISKSAVPLLVGVHVQLSANLAVDDCFIYDLTGVDYNHPEWTAFLLKYQ